ncbi:MAG: 4-hydroxythreonine-4-phosphate dehydrogenase PdxA [Alphaproteobacteria bacterium]|nr:4-hydroxythreonine-4-phosphate dehydrogenase PdxA [Alphaproteobacteria bacterium]
MSNALPLAVTMGDPAGVGPQITWWAWLQRQSGQRPFYVIASTDVATQGFAALAGQGATGVTMRQIAEPAEAVSAFPDALPVLPIVCTAPTPGSPDPATASPIIESIRLAVGHVRAGKAAAVVTNPIAKELLYKAGFKHPGHTEFLAELAAADGKAPHPVMMLAGGGLRVALATIHRPLASVPAVLTADLIAQTGRIMHDALKRDFSLPAPRIGLCGLNPHAGEAGSMGREEIDIINPAAARLRAEGVNISDARPGDTVFHEMLQGRFDAILAMYHDQGLIPVKTLDIWGGVNVTLGLPFIRTSPDHGTAYDAAANGSAKPDSLIAALKLADRMALARASTT